MSEPTRDLEIVMHTAPGHVSKTVLRDWTNEQIQWVENHARSRKDVTIEDGSSIYFFCFSSPHLILITVTPIDP